MSAMQQKALRFPVEDIRRVDNWRRRQKQIPNFNEALRVLLRRALDAAEHELNEDS